MHITKEAKRRRSVPSLRLYEGQDKPFFYFTEEVAANPFRAARTPVAPVALEVPVVGAVLPVVPVAQAPLTPKPACVPIVSATAPLTPTLAATPCANPQAEAACPPPWQNVKDVAALEALLSRCEEGKLGLSRGILFEQVVGIWC